MSSVARVAVAGAGIGGLTLAHALRQRGIEPVVLEQRGELGEVGAGITLWQNALCVLDSLGLTRALKEVAAEPSGGVIARAKGKVLTKMQLDTIDRSIPRPLMLTFHRRDLQHVLCQALPENTVRFSSAVTGYRVERECVLVQLKDGTELEADLLVGADGIGSRVRAQLLGEQAPRYAGYTCFRGVAAATADARIFGEFWGRGTRFGVVPIGGGRNYWFAVVSGPPNRKIEDAKAFLEPYFSGYAFGVPELIHSTQADAILHNDIIDRPPTSRWSKERVTLLGDSIHATTPNMGQGAAMAIESAIILARLLEARGSLDQALIDYERIRQPRTRWVTQSSWRLGKVAQLNNGVLCALRDLLIQCTPPKVQHKSLMHSLAYRAAEVEL